MGLILAALAGAGGQAADYADKSIAQDQRLEALTTESNLAQQRAEALEQFKADLGNSQRQLMVQRVQGAASDIADQKMAPIQQQEQAGITDPSSWTPEQQAAVDQSNSLTRQGIVQQALQDGSAGLASGDIAPEKAMENTSRIQINQLKIDNLLERAQDRNQTLQEIAAVRADAMRYGYELRLRAAEERRVSGKIDYATGRMLITSEDANIKASTNQMMLLQRQLENEPKVVGGKPNPRIDDIRQQLQSLRDDINTSKSNKAAYLKSMGIPGAGGAGGASSDSGAAPTVGSAPYPEGTQLVGPGGAPYIVKDGKPVPVQ